METVEVSQSERGDLRRRIEELEKANACFEDSCSEMRFASNGRIARSIAHEIRNPLTNINLAIEQLVAELPPEEHTRFLLDMINRNSNRINQIISDLLSSTRFADLKPSGMLLNETLGEVLTTLSDSMASKKIELYTKFDPAIKEIIADKTQLKQAFLNLLNNSIEATGNHPNALLTITTALQGDDVIVTIADNGKGMSEEDATKLFEPYFSKKQSGLGLSLTSVQNIILNHKGTIKFNTRLGDGTSFIICLKRGF